jgi:xanthine/CO dehydrogenase XdhC/CoxF family maturation factor
VYAVAHKPWSGLRRVRGLATQGGGGRQVLAAGGVNAGALARVQTPAGPNIGAVAPEEIALSIVVGIVEVRRRGQAVRRPLHTGRSKA